MKQKDILLIAAIVVVTGLITFVVSNFIIGSPKSRQEKVEVVEPITADFNKPENKYFNSNSIDPTQPIQISENNNQKPFDSPSGQ